MAESDTDTSEGIPLAADVSIDLTSKVDDPLLDELLTMKREVARLGGLLSESQEEIARLRIELDLFSNTDLLTGFVNRNGLLEAIEQAADRFARLTEPATILAIRIPEVDHTTVDNEDHIATVQHLGALIKAGLRRLDRVGRLDDDTFIMVLANLNRDDLDIVLERIRTALTGAPVPIARKEISIHPIMHSVVIDGSPAVPDADSLLAMCLDGMSSEAGAETRFFV